MHYTRRAWPSMISLYKLGIYSIGLITWVGMNYSMSSRRDRTAVVRRPVRKKEGTSILTPRRRFSAEV